MKLCIIWTRLKCYMNLYNNTKKTLMSHIHLFSLQNVALPVRWWFGRACSLDSIRNWTGHSYKLQHANSQWHLRHKQTDEGWKHESEAFWPLTNLSQVYDKITVLTNSFLSKWSLWGQTCDTWQSKQTRTKKRNIIIFKEMNVIFSIHLYIYIHTHTHIHSLATLLRTPC